LEERPTTLVKFFFWTACCCCLFLNWTVCLAGKEAFSGFCPYLGVWLDFRVIGIFCRVEVVVMEEKAAPEGQDDEVPGYNENDSYLLSGA
jgi:hypothetical protein